MDSVDFMQKHSTKIQELVYQQVDKFNGSISAEHGIGQLKASRLSDHKGAVAIELMAKIKYALDPKNLMNPGKVLLIKS